jgi:predicted methyltransferase
VPLGGEGLRLPDGQLLTWEMVERVAADEASHTEGHCFVLRDGRLERIQIFSPAFNRLYSLVATPAAPTMLISGIPMHRIKNSDPRRDTIAKVRTIAPLAGQVLDTATGLGYTAIEAARQADRVTTCELDPVVLEVARLNPWSAALFDNPKITQLTGDSFDLVQQFEDGAFSCVLHDPPMFNLAGELYSAEFYRHLFRVLARRGRLFHYVGNPDSPSGHRVTRGVVRRLQEAGFTRIQRRPEAFGLVALK